MKKIFKTKKGFISFIAIIMAMVVSGFCINLMSLSNANTIGMYSKRSLDKATLYALNSNRNDDVGEPEAYIVVDDAVDQFAFIAGKSFGLDGSLSFEPIKKYAGKNIIFASYGNIEVSDNRIMLGRTPNIIFAVFNYEDLVGVARAEDVYITDEEKLNEYKRIIREIINETKFHENSEKNKLIRETLIRNLFPDDYTTHGREIITKVQPITIALAEIPLGHSTFGVNTIYRFSLGKLNVYECDHIYLADCASVCYKCGKSRSYVGGTHERRFECSARCNKCYELYPGNLDHDSGLSDDEITCESVLHCKYCDCIITAVSHNMGPFYQYSELTCTTNDETRSECQRPGCEYYQVRVNRYALKHDFLSATCTSPIRCSRCEYYVEHSTQPHQFGEAFVAIEPTCNEFGQEQKICSVCGLREVTYLDKTLHIWGTAVIIKQATATEGGILEQACTICGQTQQIAIPKLT